MVTFHCNRPTLDNNRSNDKWVGYHWRHPKLLLWRTRGGNQWFIFPQSNKRIRLMAVHQVPSLRAQAWIALKVKESEVAQLCQTLCNPMDCSLPGSTVHGIFQARLQEWVAISFSRRSSQPRDWTQVSRIVGRCFTVWATREVWIALHHDIYSHPGGQTSN